MWSHPQFASIPFDRVQQLFNEWDQPIPIRCFLERHLQEERMLHLLMNRELCEDSLVVQNGELPQVIADLMGGDPRRWLLLMERLIRRSPDRISGALLEKTLLPLLIPRIPKEHVLTIFAALAQGEGQVPLLDILCHIFGVKWLFSSDWTVEIKLEVLNLF